MQQNEACRMENEQLTRGIAQRDGTITALRRQVENLQGFDPDHPTDLFAPVELEIASLTGGADYDGKPGDDGVTVYLRVLDAYGDAVKVPGEITVQLLDNSDLANPQLIGLYNIDRPAALAKAWYGRFGTCHYTLKCPFPPDTKPPASGKMDLKAEFLDYLTGATLTAVGQVELNLRADN